MKVAIKFVKDSEYLSDPPFNPIKGYPEYEWDSFSEKNIVYGGIRQLLFQLGFDKNNFGNKSWNPLKELIREGDRVLIKPTLTNEKNFSGDTVFAMINHASFVRATLDYILKTKPKEVIIADGPIPRTDFEKLCKITGLKKIVQFANKKQDISVRLTDLRDEYEDPNTLKITKLKGDPYGYTKIDLKDESLLMPIISDNKTFGSVTSIRERRDAPSVYHNLEKNEYSFSNSALKSDVVIIISKMKTHRKVGVSMGVKTVVGLDNQKYKIPHYRKGIDYSIQNKFEKFLKMGDILMRKLISPSCNLIDSVRCVDGNWYGNDTLWRSVLDLNRIQLYCDDNGKMRETKQRRVFSLIDGVIGGQNFGPLAPKLKESKVIVGGTDIVAVDVVGCVIMGFNYKSIPILKKAFSIDKYPITSIKPEQIQVVGDSDELYNIENLKKRINLNFNPPFYWVNHIENEKK